MKELWLRLNAKKSAFSTTENHLSGCGVGFDHDAGTVVSCLDRVDPHFSHESQRTLTVKQFQKLLGLMAAASNVIPFGLLYMRPLQWWLKTKWFSLCMIKVTRRCFWALDMWRKPWFLSQGPVLGAPCRRVTLTMDASLTAWGAVMSGHPAHDAVSRCQTCVPHVLCFPSSRAHFCFFPVRH